MVISIFLLPTIVSTSKLPKAYQVEGYQETIDSVTALSKLKGPNREAILANFLAEKDVVGVRNEARSKRQEKIADQQKLGNLKAQREFGGKISESQSQQIKELESKLEVGVTPKIFEGTVQDKLTGNMNEGKLNFNGKSYTFVRREGIAKSFEQMGMEIKDFKNRTEATVYLKELFADYADQYPELFAKPDWYSVSSNEMFPMINKWAQDNNIPYAGWQRSNGNHSWAGDSLYAWLPVRVAGKFAYVGSFSDDKKAYFDCGYEDSAYLSVSFMN